jgi:hypothetical protein
LNGDHIGAQASLENTTNGVLSTNFEVGTFFSNSKMEQTAFLFKPTILQN